VQELQKPVEQATFLTRREQSNFHDWEKKGKAKEAARAAGRDNWGLLRKYGLVFLVEQRIQIAVISLRGGGGKCEEKKEVKRRS